MTPENFSQNYGKRVELCPKPFPKLMNWLIMWMPLISALETTMLQNVTGRYRTLQDITERYRTLQNIVL